MAQYQVGTVSVATSSAEVTGSATLWIGNVATGDVFKISNENAPYTIGTVNSDTSITLTSGYAGSSGYGKSYQIVKDFSDNFGFYLIAAGDRDYPFHLTNKFIVPLDSLLGERLQGVGTITVTTSGSTTLSSTQCAYPVWKIGGALLGNSVLIIPTSQLALKRQITLHNKTTESYTLTVSGGAGSVVVGQDKICIVYSDGSDIFRVTPDT